MKQKFFYGESDGRMWECPDIFYSAKDLEDIYGKSHQYWSKVMKQKKLKYQQTKAGKITTKTWIEEFLKIIKI